MPQHTTCPGRFSKARPVWNRKRNAVQIGSRDRPPVWVAEFFWWVAILMYFAGTYSRAQVAAEYAGAVSGMSSAGVQVHPAEKTVFVPEVKKQNALPHLRQSGGASGEEANRKELEGSAGTDAGKLLLRSEPARAAVWIEGKRIGSTPLLLMLAPGSYRVELRGARQEYAARHVDLQPRETRNIVIPLEQRYPSHVQLR